MNPGDIMLNSNIQNQLVNNPLSYRSILTLPKNARFGLEIELENVNYDLISRYVRNQFGQHWYVKDDRSLMKDKNAEIVTPVLYNEKKTWILLKKLAQMIKKLSPTFDNCSFQVNFDGSLLPTSEDRITFLKLYAYYEDIIYRFSKGENANYRESLDMYASPIILALKDVLNFDEPDKEFILERFSNNKRYGIIFKNKSKDLIEFRTPNGTYNPILWQNYITLFYYLIEAITKRKYDLQELNEYISSYSKINILESYELSREEKALKLSKQIFSKQLDKTSFLHQYIGSNK